MPNFDDARAPDGVRIYAIGDIHGRLDCLLAVHRLIEDDLAARPVADWRVIHVGDYVDRGPNSAGVIEHLAARRAADPRTICLKGNHDVMLETFLSGEDEAPNIWVTTGGYPTLLSYDVPKDAPFRLDDAGLVATSAAAVPAEHRAFLKSLDRMVAFGDYLFVHAGIAPEVPLAEQTDHDLTWMGEPFLSWEGDLGAVVVHGHTIRYDGPEVRPNRINIDTGAFVTDFLCCIVLEGQDKKVLCDEGLFILAP